MGKTQAPPSEFVMSDDPAELTLQSQHLLGEGLIYDEEEEKLVTSNELHVPRSQSMHNDADLDLLKI